MAGSSLVCAVIVTYNSDRVAPRAVQALLESSRRPDRIVIVDNGSVQIEYLARIEGLSDCIEVLRLPENTGFCAANNHGASRSIPGSHLLLVNPDAFVAPSFLEDALAKLESDPTVGAIGPKLMTSSETGVPLGTIDSAGIGQTRLGRFYDRGRGQRDDGQFDSQTEPEALCAAAVLIRNSALSDIGGPSQLFDSRFFMYKEDIDLSFRLRRASWRLVFDPSLQVLHCRGWNSQRRQVPGWARRMSMRNEWRLWFRGWTPGRLRAAAVPYLVLKTLAVMLGR